MLQTLCDGLWMSRSTRGDGMYDRKQNFIHEQRQLVVL